MASARITQRWPDGTELTAAVSAESSYPDAIAEIRAQVVSLWREVTADEDARDA